MPSKIALERAIQTVITCMGMNAEGNKGVSHFKIVERMFITIAEIGIVALILDHGYKTNT
jgi:hypothetical protein